MGWSFSLLVVNERGPGALAAFPRHNAPEAHRFLAQHHITQVRQSQLTNLDRSLNPKKPWFGIGAYGGILLVTGIEEITNFPEKAGSKFVESLRAHHNDAEILICEVASATNYACYWLYQQREVVRFVAVDSETVHVVNGTALSEEQSYGFDTLQVGPAPPHVRYGEAVVFNLLARYLGKPFDYYSAEKLTVELVKRIQPIWPFSALGK
jgi:hypothetical protein